MNKNDREYIALTIEKAVKNNISVALVSENYVIAEGETIPSAGFFDPIKRQLVCATKGKFEGWFGVFIHESCHMDQFIENAKPWADLKLGKSFKEEDACDIFFQWLEGIPTCNKLVRQSCKKTLLMELDCEKRTAEKIKKHNLSINLERYIKSANVYILFYNFIKKHRIWHPRGRSPSKYQSLKNLVSSSFDENYNVLPKKFEDAVIEYCFQGKLEEYKKQARIEQSKYRTLY